MMKALNIVTHILVIVGEGQLSAYEAWCTCHASRAADASSVCADDICTRFLPLELSDALIPAMYSKRLRL